MQVTAEKLRKMGACKKDGIDVFAAEWPDGCNLTKQVVLRAIEIGLDVDWFARQNLTGAALAEYHKQVAPFWTEYKKQVAPFWAEYDKQVAPLKAKYYKQVAPFKAECEKQRAPLRAEYKKQRALLFWRFWEGV